MSETQVYDIVVPVSVVEQRGVKVEASSEDEAKEKLRDMTFEEYLDTEYEDVIEVEMCHHYQARVIDSWPKD